MRRWVPLLSALLAPLALAVAFLGPSLVGRETFLATDLLEREAPWAATSELGGQVDNGCLSDTVDGAVPDLELVAQGLARGEWPQTTTLQVSSTTLLATPTSGALSPLVLPFLGAGTATTAWIKLAELVTVVLGCVLLVRRLGLGVPAGVVAGAALASSAFMVQWTNWPQTRTLAVAPLVLWAVERFVQERTVRSAMVLPLVMTALLLGGFPAVVVHVAYLALLWFAVRVVAVGRADGWRQVRRAVVLAAAAGAAFAGLVAAQVLALRDVLSVADLTGRGSGREPSFTPPADTPAVDVVTAVLPHALGTCGSGVGYWGELNPVEDSLFVGGAVLLLAVVGAVLPPRAVPRGIRALLVAVVAVVAVVILVGGPLTWVLAQVPLVAGNPLGRLRGVMGLCLALLAAFGAHRLLVEGLDRRGARRRLVWASGLLALGALAGAPLLLHARGRAVEGAWAVVAPGVALGVACTVVAAAVVLLLLRGGPPRRWPAVVLGVVIAVEAVSYAGAFWARSPADTFYRDTTVHAYLREHQGHDKTASVGWTMYGNAPSVAGVRSLTGHEFVSPAWRRLLLAVDPQMLRSHSSLALSSPSALDSPVLDRLGVRYGVVAPGELAPGDRVEEVSPDPGAPATTAGPDGAVEGTAVPDRPVRAVSLVVPTPSERDRRLTVALQDDDGTTLATGSATVRAGAGGYVDVWVDDPPAAGEATRVRVDADAEVDLWSTPQGTAWTGFVVGEPDLRKVLDDGAVVYERTTALPRVRWAGSTREVGDLDEAVRELASGTVPRDAVVVTGDVAASVETDGRGATVGEVQEDDGALVAQVRADGAGLLVVADAFDVPGWRVEVDGQAVAPVVVDGGLTGVPVPEGDHEVRIAFEQRGATLLRVVAVVALLAVLAGLAWPAVASRRRRGVEP